MGLGAPVAAALAALLLAREGTGLCYARPCWDHSCNAVVRRCRGNGDAWWMGAGTLIAADLQARKHLALGRDDDSPQIAGTLVVYQSAGLVALYSSGGRTAHRAEWCQRSGDYNGL